MIDPITLILASPLALCALALFMRWLDHHSANKLRVRRDQRTLRAVDDAHAAYMRSRR